MYSGGIGLVCFFIFVLFTLKEKESVMLSDEEKPTATVWQFGPQQLPSMRLDD